MSEEVEEQRRARLPSEEPLASVSTLIRRLVGTLEEAERCSWELSLLESIQEITWADQSQSHCEQKQLLLRTAMDSEGPGSAVPVRRNEMTQRTETVTDVNLETTAAI